MVDDRLVATAAILVSLAAAALLLLSTADVNGVGPVSDTAARARVVFQREHELRDAAFGRRSLASRLELVERRAEKIRETVPEGCAQLLPSKEDLKTLMERTIHDVVEEMESPGEDGL